MKLNCQNQKFNLSVKLAEDQIGISGALTWPDQFAILLSPQQVSGGIFGFDLIWKVSGAHNITDYIIHQARWKEGRAPWDLEGDVICQN